MKKKIFIANIFSILTILFAVLIASSLVSSYSLNALSLADYEAKTEYKSIGGNYFMSDYDTAEEVVEAGKILSLDTIAEGTVLLKNEDNVLPLKSERKISLFGKNAYALMSDFIGALRNEGFEINPELINFYNNNELTGDGAHSYPGNGVVLNGLPTGEADISKFDDTTNSIEQYGDAAIVAFYRTSGEGWDLPRTMGQVNGNYKEFGPDIQPVEGARAVDDHQLQLDKNEAALLDYCSQHFEKVIVIINSPAPMELGFLDDPDHYAYHEQIKGALWTNTFRYEAWPSLASVLTGEVNPSGHLPDTYARDFKADPTWNNFGNNFMEDYYEGDALQYMKGNQYANENMHGGGGNGGGGYYSNYVYYKEGIYSAYRYWETRGFTEGTDKKWVGETTDTLSRYAHGPNEAIHYYSKLGADKEKQEALDSKEWDNWYKAHVVFPFGYGLSYTEFAWELVDSADGGELAEDGEITVTVKVTNIGEVAGKDVVQLYYSAPYIEGQIEKSHVNLGAFAKTKLLEPNESENITLTMKVRDMASYDWNDANGNTFKGYELDPGTYNIYVGENAHCWAEPDVLKKTYNLSAGIKYENDGTTGNKVENRFDTMSEQLLHEDRYPEDEEKNEKDKYMTRNDWGETWPTLSYRLTAEQWIIDGLKEYNDVSEAPFGTVYPEDKPSDPWYNDVMPTLGAKYETPIKLNQLFGLDYDDPLWEDFLDQLTYDQLRELALCGNYSSGIDIPELGITKEHNQDHPTGVNLPGNPPLNVYLSNDIMTAASWNRDIAYRKGNILANISMWGGGNVASRVPGWYAPAVNIHRNPFGGRVGEYFSEDGHLTGVLASQIVIGAQEKGMWCYVKHFAVNNQETNRCGLITWANEQSMREIYFKPFELCVKEGKTMGIMSSLNRFGPRWAGGSYELLTEVLRNEWGFHGNVVTDSFASWSNADIMIRAGGSLALGNAPALKVAPESATTVNCLRNCAHDILYTHANSFAINEGETPTVPKIISKFVSKTLNTGIVGVEYNESIKDCLTINTDYYPNVTISDVNFSLSGGGALPEGLTLTSDGKIVGTPKITSKITFTVEAVYKNEQITERSKQQFTINIISNIGTIIYDSAKTHIDATVGEELNCTVASAKIFDPYADGNTILPEIRYSLANGSRLPEGLTLKSDGTIVGTPTKECRDYKFTVTASALGYRDVSCEFTLSALYQLSYSGSSLEHGSYGKSYIADINTATCDAPVTYTLKSGSTLPKGLTLTPGGYIVGVPQEACKTTFTVIASSAYAESIEATYTLTIDPSFASSTTLPNGKMGVKYIGSVATAQGTFDTAYSIVDGELPTGLTMSTDGNITGTPEVSGTFTIKVRASEGELSDEIILTLFIYPSEENANASQGCGSVINSYNVFMFIIASVFAFMTVLIAAIRKKKD